MRVTYSQQNETQILNINVNNNKNHAAQKFRSTHRSISELVRASFVHLGFSM